MSGERRPALFGPRDHRFLSPHYDDIALSCGGTVAALARSGVAPAIVVLFGAGPAAGAALSPFAAENHRDWGIAADEVIAVRRQEERHATAELGATVSWLPFPDAIYRGDRYLNNDQLFGEPAAAEADLPSRLVAAIGAPPVESLASRFYAPLAVGGHVDHRQAFEAGRALARAGQDVWFYEDLPYALRPGLLDARLAALGSAVSLAAIVPIGEVWPIKLAAILAYPSQLARTFSFAGVGGGQEEIAAVLGASARRVGGGVPAERFWRMSGAPVAPAGNLKNS